MTAKTAIHTTTISRSRAEALLYPMAAFLSAGGLSQNDAERSFARAFTRSLVAQGARQIRHIGNPAPYADIVARWIRDRRFIDRDGCSRPLTLKGRTSFTTLVRAASPTTAPRLALSVLMQFKNVKRLKSGKYKLVSPFFLTTSAKRMAFEPIAYFLSDASDTLGRILKRKEGSPLPDLFWRKAEDSNLSKTAINKFLAFGKERTLAFVHEIDEWLEAHRSVKSKGLARRSSRRVGLGVFSIFSKVEPLRPRKSSGYR